MGVTPDRFPGTREEEEIQLIPGTESPSADGMFSYRTGVGFEFQEEGVVKSLTGTGISPTQHRALRQLIHFINQGPAEGFASGAFKETLPINPFPTSVIWYESAVKAKKIVEKLITWSGVLPAVIEWNMYDTDGVMKLATVSDSISYSGVFETTRTRTITVH